MSFTLERRSKVDQYGPSIPELPSDPYGNHENDQVMRSCIVDNHVAPITRCSALFATCHCKSSLFDGNQCDCRMTNAPFNLTYADCKLGEKASSRVPNHPAPRLICPKEFYSRLMIIMPNLESRDLVVQVDAFFLHHDMLPIRESFCNKAWEITYTCGKSYFRVTFYSEPDGNGSCVTLHRDSGCGLLVADMGIALRGWLEGNVDAATFTIQQPYIPDCGTDNWDWLNFAELDMHLISELAQQNVCGLASLREKLRPHLQEMIANVRSVDIRHLIDLLAALLQGNPDYLAAPDMMALSRLALRTTRSNREHLAYLGTILTPIQVEAIAYRIPYFQNTTVF